MHDQSKFTICSTHDPYQVIRSEFFFFFFHLQWFDSNGHSLRCLHLEIWQFFVDDNDNNNNNRWTDLSLYPLHMHMRYISEISNKLLIMTANNFCVDRLFVHCSLRNSLYHIIIKILSV